MATKKSSPRGSAPKTTKAKATTKAAPGSGEADAGASKATQAGGGAGAEAAALLAAEDAAAKVAELGEQMMDSRSAPATKAARVLAELIAQKPELLVPLVDKLARSLTSKHKRVVQTAADALPEVARVAPARVARQLEVLKGSFDPAIAEGRDGLVRTFAALCTASVAYQKRLEPVLTHALEVADGKTLVRWTEIVLPALKGEPHARARAVVERRLYTIPRARAQQIADFLGIRLRASYRG